MACCLDGKQLPFVRNDPAGIKDVVLWLLPEEALGMSERRVQHIRVDAVECLQPVGDSSGDSEDPLRLGQVQVVVATHGIAHRQALRSGREIVPLRAPQVVGGAVMVNEPQSLVRVPQRVARWPNRDQHIRSAVHLQQPHRQRLVQENVPTRAGRNGHCVNLMPPSAQRIPEVAHDLL